MTNLKSIRNTLLLIIIALLFSACSENEDILAAESNLTEEEAVLMVESSLKASTAGLVETTQSYSLELSNNPSLEDLCNTPQEELFTYSYEDALVSASYNMNWQYQLSCNNFNIPQNIGFNSSATGIFSSQRISSNDTATSQFQLKGLEPSSLEYVFNGSYKREGSQSLITNFNSRNVTSELLISIDNLLVSKNTNTINSGFGTLILSGTTEQTGAFSFEGEIEFLGNGQAILKINGTVYEIDLN